MDTDTDIQSKALQCHLCLSNNVILFDSFANIDRAASDCKPWPKGGKLCICTACCTVQKVIDSSWRAEVSEIYANYELYHQATDEREQPVFNSITGTSTPRSVAVLEYAQQVVGLKSDSKVIDIGCGVGNMLKSLSRMLTTAELYGFEPNVHKKQVLEQIENVAGIYTEMSQLKNIQFDLLTMIHVLEHIDSPMQVLEKLKNNITPDGYLLIAVPDYTTNPFDLIITDHASHFSLETLHNLLLNSGLEVIDISNTIINKEIVAVCKVPAQARQSAATMIRPIYNQDLVQKQLDWMRTIIDNARDTAESNRPFGIFGTSIAANWMYGALSDVVDYFVDEDQDRVDKLYHQKPVYSASKIPNGSHTYVCLQPNVVGNVMKRFSSSGYCLYATPDF